MNEYEEFNVVKAIESPARNREITVHGDPNGSHFTVQEIIELYLMSLDFKVNKFTDRIFSVSSPSFVYEGETVGVKSRRVESVEEMASSLGRILRTSSSKIFVLSFSCHKCVSPEDFTEQKSYLMRYAVV